MRNLTGYFLAGSKFGGLTSKPSTSSPRAPLNQKDSSGDTASWERTASLRYVSLRGGGGGRCPHGLSRPLGQRRELYIAFGSWRELFVKRMSWPSGVTTKSSAVAIIRRGTSSRSPVATKIEETGDLP